MKVEAYNFDIRKHLVEYDDVINLHRDKIYGDRRSILAGADLKANIQDYVHGEIEELVVAHTSGHDQGGWTLGTLEKELLVIMPLPPELRDERLYDLAPEEIQEALIDHTDALYEERQQELGADQMRAVEQAVMLRVNDAHWVEHLTAMQNLREGIGLQAYGQRDPLVMYRIRAREMFDDLRGEIQHDIAHTIFHVAPVPTGGDSGGAARPQRGATTAASQPSVMANAVGNRRATAMASGNKVGRNEPCPCGSGKKYKRCHGAAA